MKPERWLELKEGAPVLGRLGAEGIQHVEPQLGHVYLLRYAFDGNERILAFQVVELIPEQSVTLRVRVLSTS